MLPYPHDLPFDFRAEKIWMIAHETHEIHENRRRDKHPVAGRMEDAVSDTFGKEAALQ